MNSKDYLIIGSGIAGSTLAYRLMQINRSFNLIDSGKKIISTRLAAGMFNVVNAKRMTISWKAELLLPEVQKMMTSLERESGKSFYHELPVHQAFGSVKESNDFASKMEYPGFSRYVKNMNNCDPSIKSPFGCFETSDGGWVHTDVLLDFLVEKFRSAESYLTGEFRYNQLQQDEIGWVYEGVLYKHVIFCEGYQITHNPFFAWLPFRFCKGQVLKIKCKGLNSSKILKKGVYLVHLGDDIYKVGATYEWDVVNENPDQQGLETLKEKLDNMLTQPYKVLDHYAGVRPATRDRYAILGEHPELNHLYVFNGLGAKGILQAPFLSQHLISHIEKKTPLFNEINISRFRSFYSTGQ